MAKEIEKTKQPTPSKMEWDEFRSLVKSAAKGDGAALAKVRKVMGSGDYEGWSRWFRETYGNPAKWLEGTLIQIPDKGNLAIEEASEAKMNELRRELEGPNPTPLERLLVERAVHCWFILNLHESFYAQATNLSTAQAEFHIRRIGADHKRFLTAVATLARVRKLALPSLQVVSMGPTQVNVGKPG